MSPNVRKWLRRLIPVGIILVGALVMMGLAKTRKPPQRQKVESSGALVEVVKAQRAPRNILIDGTGTVQSRYEVTLIPQVSGKIEWVHPRMEAGGYFSRGDTLLRIEQDDYELAVQQAEAQVAQAEYQYQVAGANAEIAEREWEMMQAGRDKQAGEPDPLVLHKPQLRQAEAALQSAEAALDRAKLNLQRTVLTAPFNCMIRQESAAVGQLVGPSSMIASLYETDVAEIEVTMPVADLRWIKVPGADATIHYSTGDHVYEWEGRVDRTIGVLDQVGRLARVVVQVRNPFTNRDPLHPVLHVGSFVTVIIEGREVVDAIPLPRRALRENNRVWVATGDSTLDFRKVELYRLTPDEALVSEGLEDGEHVVLTSISAAAPGMKLRLQQAEATP